MQKQNKNKQIADKLVDTLLNLTAQDNWHKEWTPTVCGFGCNSFMNYKTGKYYSGVNFINLFIFNKQMGFKETRFLTFKQCKELGGNLQAGSTGCELLYFSEYDRNTHKEFDSSAEPFASMTEEEQLVYIQENVYLFAKTFYVFNIEQTTGIDWKPAKLTEKKKKDIERKTNAFCERVINNSAAKVHFVGGDRAFYSPATDSICLPARNSFKTLAGLYSTAMHEIGHSTGHPSRLNRDMEGRFGSMKYAREELIAEFCSVMVQNTAGINLKVNNTLKNSACYIRNWLQALREENKQTELLTAIRQADKASKFICDNYGK